MTDCYLCDKIIENNTNYLLSHIDCDKLWRQRRDDNICVRCGRNPIIHRLHPWCKNCKSDSDYLNY